MQPSMETIERVIATALAEDLGRGDITSQAVIPAGARFRGVMAAREELVVAGLDFARQIFARLAPDLEWQARVAEGQLVATGGVLADLAGPALELLTAERTALNLLQHLSGIATLTRRYVQAVAGTGVVVLDTRKTLPGLRELAKYATRLGGARNHRLRLDDGVLIKDNHLAVCGSVSEAMSRARAAGLQDIEVECDTLDQVVQALEAGAERLLLDNMDNATLRRAVALAKGRATAEASGGVNLETIAGIAATGVDFISVGRLTQSAPAMDIGLDWSLA
ncbi:MAG: carboxylating nicotinate-nucleotide diphosphorylase [Deltaproteobacteria bacterium]|nr:carboxylating nicotinate-nucleotide diphosphorylase [Deltaproteobacteria bacterium]